VPERSRFVYTARVLILLVASAGVVFGGLAFWDAAPRISVGEVRSRVEPLDGATSVRLFALGDSGTGDAAQYQVAAAMEGECVAAQNDPGRTKVSAILLLGDNFYMDGVAGIDDSQWQEKFEKPYGLPCLGTLPVHPVLGNHDYRLSPAAQISYSATSTRWRMPARNWRVDFGNLVRVVGVDTNFFDFCFSSRWCSFDFMLGELPPKASGNETLPAWRIVTAHHPLASSSSKGHSHTGRPLGPILSPFVCSRADVWISGHAHQLERRQPADCGTELIIAGGGGGELGELVRTEMRSKDVQFLSAEHGFADLEFTATQMRARFVSADGRELDAWQRTKQ